MSQAGQLEITVSAPVALTFGHVGAHHVDELVPLAGDQHRRGAAELLRAEVGEVDAGLVEQAHRGDADVVLDEARRAAGEVDGRRGDAGTVPLAQVLREPRVAVLAVPGPDVALGGEGRAHHLERRERHVPVVLNELAAELHPARLDREGGRAADVAELARGADQEGVDHFLVPFHVPGHVLAQPVPLAARRLTLPAATVILIALLDAIAAL